MPSYMAFYPYAAEYILRGYDEETYAEYLERIGIPKKERVKLVAGYLGLRLVE